jgi:uncharacterized protein involved in outer membrane biogenesis
MRDRWRGLARAGLLLAGVLLAALVIAALIVQLPVLQRWAAAEVAARLPPGVGIDRVALTLLPPGVRLTNVALAPDGPTFSAVSCHLRIAPLLAGRAEVAAVVVDGATIAIERSADGTFQIAGPLAELLADDTGGTAPPPFSLAELPAVRVDNLTLTFVDRFGRGGAKMLSLTAVRLTLGAGASGAVPLTLAGRIDPAGQIEAHGSMRHLPAAGGRPADHAIELAVTARALDAQTALSYLAAILPGGGSARAQGGLDGSLTLSGSLLGGLSGDVRLTQSVGSMVWDDVAFGAPTELAAHITTSSAGVAFSDGQLTIAHLAAARIAATDLTAAFTYGEQALHLTAARASLYGGTWTQSGLVTLADPPDFDISVRADGIACDALLTAITGEHPEYGCERFSAEADVRGEWRGADSVADRAEGSGRIEMSGGTIPSSSIIGALWHAMVPLVASGRAPRGIGDPTRVDRLTESFALRRGRMHTDDLRLITDDYTVTGTGSIGLDGTLDLDTEVALTPAGIAKLLVMAALPIPGELPDLPPISTRITGTVGSPFIRPEVEELPLAALRGLFRGALGAGEAAGRGLRGLKDGLEKAW